MCRIVGRGRPGAGRRLRRRAVHGADGAGFPRSAFTSTATTSPTRSWTWRCEAGVGRIVVDNAGELERLEAAARAGRAARPDVLLRITPGVDAHTHSYIQTGQLDSKFGIPIAGGQALAAAKRAAAIALAATAGIPLPHRLANYRPCALRRRGGPDGATSGRGAKGDGRRGPGAEHGRRPGHPLP